MLPPMLLAKRSGDGENRTRVHGLIDLTSTSVDVTRHGLAGASPAL